MDSHSRFSNRIQPIRIPNNLLFSVDSGSFHSISRQVNIKNPSNNFLEHTRAMAIQSNRNYHLPLSINQHILCSPIQRIDPKHNNTNDSKFIKRNSHVYHLERSNSFECGKTCRVCIEIDTRQKQNMPSTFFA